MAETLGIQLKTYARSETGERAMDAGELNSLAEAGAPLEWLITGRGEMLVRTVEGDRRPEMPGAVKPTGPGDAALRKRPTKHAEIPEHIKGLIESMCIFLEDGKRSYVAALAASRVISAQIEDELGSTEE